MSQLERLEEAYTPPMHLMRPQWLSADIEQRFNRLQSQGLKDYSFNGETPDYTFDELDCTALEVVDSLARQRSEPLRVLDIGAGAGGLVLQCLKMGHQAQGLSAHPYKEYTRFNTLTGQIPADAYIVGDAQRISEVPELMDAYDLIVSRHTFMHLADPLGTLEQAANRVRKGGILVILGVNIEGNHYYPQRELSSVTAEHVLAGLASGGFRTNGSKYDDSDVIGRQINAVFAQREADDTEVRLAVSYLGGPNGWSYVRTDS
jgi:2-polyprenyl-3-methyl-5-hydroxy-6-metoxy-1,4-benzoquinol methylase